MTRCVLNTAIDSPENKTDAASRRPTKMETYFCVTCPLPLGEGGAQRRVREARPTIRKDRGIVGRVALIRRCAPPSPDGRRLIIYDTLQIDISETFVRTLRRRSAVQSPAEFPK